MLHSYNDLASYAIRAADGRTGAVEDIYFDDSTWRIRYLVARAGFPLIGRQSLVGADLLGPPDTSRQEVPVELSKEQLKSAPPTEADAPVSEQSGGAEDVRDVAVWPPFLVSSGVPYSPTLAMEQLGFWPRGEPGAPAPERPADPHLRSMSEVSTYVVAATDDEIGSVVDFLIDPDGWQVQFLVIDTGTWLPGRRVVITTGWVTGVDAADSRLHVKLDRDTVENAPRLDDVEELRLSDARRSVERYGTIGYWPI